MGNILNFMLGVKLASMIINHQYIHNLSSNITMDNTMYNQEKIANFKDNIETKIKTFFEELKAKKFNRDECLQHFPGCFHFDDPLLYKKSEIFNITEEVTIKETNVFPEFSIVFLIV